MIATSLWSRSLLVASLSSSILLFNENTVQARPVSRSNDAPPLTRSVSWARQAAFDSHPSANVPAALLHTSLFGQDEGQTRAPQYVKTLDERSLVTDLLGSLLEPLSIIPGVVQVQDILLGDGGEDKGLFGKLSGLLLTVEPEGSSSGGEGASNASNTSDPAATAAKSSYRYSLMASKDQKTQVFLMPVHQANAAEADPSQGTNITSDTTPVSASNDTMTVKMMLHMLDATGAPVVMCASYGSTPPTDLTIETCGGDASTSSSSDGNATTTDASMQLFSYTQSTGALKPMFKKADDEPATSTTDSDAASATNNSTVTPAGKVATEMRLIFAATPTDDVPTSPEKNSSEASPSVGSAAPASQVTGASTNNTAIDQSSRRITLGRQFVARPRGARQRNAGVRQATSSFSSTSTPTPTDAASESSSTTPSPSSSR